MLYRDMSESMKGKFRRYHVCKVCGQVIEQFEDCQFIQYKIGRRISYNFLHTLCLNPSTRVRMADLELTREGV